jgi:hypothetical protein
MDRLVSECAACGIMEDDHPTHPKAVAAADDAAAVGDEDEEPPPAWTPEV